LQSTDFAVGSLAGVQLLTGDDLSPEDGLLRIKRQRSRYPPEPGSLVPAASQDDSAVWAKGHGIDSTLMHERWTDRPAGGRVPEPGGPVPAAGHERSAVGAEGDGRDRGTVLQGRTDWTSRRRVPEPGAV